MAFNPTPDTHPVIKSIADFDTESGSIVERAIFNHRKLIISLCVFVTLFLGFEAIHLKLNANFEGTIPLHDPFMVNYLNHFDELQSNGNALRIAVAADSGTIATAHYLDTLQQVTNDVLYLPGINRPYTSSLWTPQTLWTGVDQNGISIHPVIDQGFDGSPVQVANVMQNILKTNRVGELVAADFKSSMIYAPLMNHNGLTGGPIEYGALARSLDDMRAKYAKQGVSLHVTGFAMVVGDMILGIQKILVFFALSVGIVTAMLYWFTRCSRSTFLVVSCTGVAVIWQLGLLPLLGYDLDPYSVLVPFLIFAIGMSHGAQKMNGVMQDIGRGTHKQVAARYTFRRLFVAGFTALTCDAVGFAVLGLIRIQEIQELAIIAGCGVAILIFTNLILLPILLSYVGVSKKAALRSLGAENARAKAARFSVWDFLARFTQRKFALPTVIIATLLAIGGYAVGRNAQIGNVGDGAPELRQTSQYNQDVRWTQAHYSVSSDTLTVMVDSPPYDCTTYRELATVQKLAWALQQMPEVQSAIALPAIIAKSIQTVTDNSPKWNAVLDNQSMINDVVLYLPPGWTSLDCSFVPVNISLNSLKNESLQKVVSAVQTFAANPKNQSPNFAIKLAAGNAGIAFATNRVIALASEDMLIWIYMAVAILCYITFRSWLAVLCAVLPLMLTSILCKALMVFMHIGVTVATLPVIALGVGIGVDYALYVLGVMMTHLRAGVPLEEAYLRSLKFTGRVVMLTGFTLAVGVGTWAFAPIKFQADMGLLLAFMFLLNMFGALMILPALANFLLKSSPKNSDHDPGAGRGSSTSFVPSVVATERNAGLIGSS